MEQKIVIIGAGGFGREVKWLIERINNQERMGRREGLWNLIGFIDDGYVKGEMVSELPILGTVEELASYSQVVFVVCAIGASGTRKQVVEKLLKNPNIKFPNVLDPSVLFHQNLKMGKGNIICAGTILTVEVCLKDFVIVNLDCTVGHDVVLNSFVTVYPGVNLSGFVEIGEGTELGTGCQIIQEKQVGGNAVIGAGAVVIRDIPAGCTAVGNPAKPVRF